ncbi:hypothetical protein DNTS_028377 [Danionella cerebrum]|uniref:Ras-associating domain-containing protein n=1 Tax=Danionella cerebrum TaxID=2873325 RepID=A0A553MSW4_9TELE|nr:hypothetical protein DNTS_028377 [Danionella translucida]TRY56260.1 hypothetical protein DNTS_028377 [Danionella translucida]
MELKVWVDGVVRVVCGLSQETSCQDIVIALAQAIGQTGRYVLIQRLRDTERQLLANEHPLESLSKLGQHSSEVQFFLLRTGPSSSEDESLQGRTLPHSLSESKSSLARKSFLGSSCSPNSRYPRKTTSPDLSSPPVASDSSNSPVPNPVNCRGPSKEEMFVHVLQQQEQLHALESQLRESDLWKQPSAGESSLLDELEVLEKLMLRNEQELMDEEICEIDLRAEMERERTMKERLEELHAKLDDCGTKLHELSNCATQLEEDIQREMLKQEFLPINSDSKDSLDVVKATLESRQMHGEELEAELTEMEKALGRAETLLKVKQEEMEELNKDLRQCNLQQFIQHTLPRVEELEHQQQSKDNESPPRPTAKQFLGHPRNLQHPLVSSLNPEGVYV